MIRYDSVPSIAVPFNKERLGDCLSEQGAHVILLLAGGLIVEPECADDWHFVSTQVIIAVYKFSNTEVYRNDPMAWPCKGYLFGEYRPFMLYGIIAHPIGLMPVRASQYTAIQHINNYRDDRNITLCKSADGSQVPTRAGYYIIKYQGAWSIVHWDGSHYLLPGHTQPQKPTEKIEVLQNV